MVSSSKFRFLKANNIDVIGRDEMVEFSGTGVESVYIPLDDVKVAFAGGTNGSVSSGL